MRVASRPRVFPSASTRYHWRSISPGFAVQVFCIEAASYKPAEARFYQRSAGCLRRRLEPGEEDRWGDREEGRADRQCRNAYDVERDATGEGQRRAREAGDEIV